MGREGVGRGDVVAVAAMIGAGAASSVAGTGKGMAGTAGPAIAGMDWPAVYCSVS